MKCWLRSYPYDGDSAVTVLPPAAFQKPLPPIISENPNVPQALENVVIKATKNWRMGISRIAEMYWLVQQPYERRNGFDDVARKQTPRPCKNLTCRGQQFHLLSQLQLKRKRLKLRKRRMMRLKFQRRLRTRYKVLSLQSYWFGGFCCLLYNSPSIPACQMFWIQTVAEARSAIEAKKLVVGDEKGKTTVTMSRSGKGSLKLIHRLIVGDAEGA